MTGGMWGSAECGQSSQTLTDTGDFESTTQMLHNRRGQERKRHAGLSGYLVCFRRKATRESRTRWIIHEYIHEYYIQKISESTF